jgi:uncharacterized membrane protein YfcA
VISPLAAGLLLLGTGALAGAAAGLLGVGGGLVVVPALTFLFAAWGLEPGLAVHSAVGTSLATIVVTGTASVRAHHRHGAVLWPRVRRLGPAVAVGAVAGALLAHHMPGPGLRAAVGVFELLVAVRMAFSAFAPREGQGRPDAPLWGLPIGAVSALVGIGGGTLTVPYLAARGVSLHRAVGTGAALGVPIALAGGIALVLVGWGEAGLPAPRLGYVYLPGFAAVAVASALFAPLGARLAHRLPADRLRRVFAVVLAVAGLRMLSL